MEFGTIVVRGAAEVEAVAVVAVPILAMGAPCKDQTDRMDPAPQNSVRCPAQGYVHEDSATVAVVIVLPQ